MDRLTTGNKIPSLRSPFAAVKALKRLSDYEDTGLTPDEIERLKLERSTSQIPKFPPKSLNKLYCDIKSKYGYQAANDWLEAEWGNVFSEDLYKGNTFELWANALSRYAVHIPGVWRDAKTAKPKSGDYWVAVTEYSPNGEMRYSVYPGSYDEETDTWFSQGKRCKRVTHWTTPFISPPAFVS